MIVTNSEGLTREEADKVLRPYARNTGKRHHPKDAAQNTVAFLDANPAFLDEVGELLDNAQD